MWKHIYTGAMAGVYFYMVTGMFIVAYGNALGVSYRAWGLLGGFSSFAQVLQLVGAHMGATFRTRRGVWFAFAMAERLSRGLALAAALYLASVNPQLMSLAFVGLLALGSCFGALATPPWFSWLADIIPENVQGEFWGRRQAWIALATVAALIPAARFYDWGVRNDLAISSLLVIFAFGIALGVTDLLIHRTIPEPPIKEQPRAGLLEQVLAVLRDRGFRPWLQFVCFWNFAMVLGGSMCMLYFVKDLFRESFTTGVLVVNAVPLVIQVLTAKSAGYFVDRFGTKRVLACGHFLWALVPLPWIVATPRTAAWWIVGADFVETPATNAASNAATKFVTRYPKREDRAMYWAVSSSLGSLAGGIGAILAGELLETFSDRILSLGALKLDGFKVLFITSLLLRLGAAFLTLRLKPPPGESPR